MKMEGDHPDTVPGFMMQSQNFVLKFITGLQKGVVSKLLEMDTDWLVHGDSQVDAVVDVDVDVDGDGCKVVDGAAERDGIPVVSKLLEMETDWLVHIDSQVDADADVDGGGRGGDGHHGALECSRQQAPGDGDKLIVSS